MLVTHPKPTAASQTFLVHYRGINVASMAANVEHSGELPLYVFDSVHEPPSNLIADVVERGSV